MKTSISGSLAALVIGASLMLPALASAQTSDTQTQIQALLTQIQALQKQLSTLVIQAHASSTSPWNASSTPPMMGGGARFCLELMRDLKPGSQGDDVSQLQQQLSGDHDLYPEGLVTGFFGPATQRAVVRMQQKFGIATSTTGFFGPLSRDFMKRQCGEGPGKPGMMGSSTPPWIGGTIIPRGDDDHRGSSTRPMTGMMPWMGSTTPPIPPPHHDGPQNY